MVDTDDTRRTTDDERRTTPWVWHKLPTGELMKESLIRHFGFVSSISGHYTVVALRFSGA